MLATVDMDSLELIPDSFSNVKEWGQSDLAFKARIKGGPEIFVGIGCCPGWKMAPGLPLRRKL